MDLKNSIIDFWGSCNIKSNLTLDELASILSKAMFGGLPFVDGKYSVWEEIPSKYLEHSILGMFIIIGGYGGEEGFTLAVQPFGEFGRYLHTNNLKEKVVKIELNFHIYHLLKQGLQKHPEIEIIECESLI